MSVHEVVSLSVLLDVFVGDVHFDVEGFPAFVVTLQVSANIHKGGEIGRNALPQVLHFQVVRGHIQLFDLLDGQLSEN